MVRLKYDYNIILAEFKKRGADLFMYIKRHMEMPVMTLSQQYPVLLITGPRQVGKTTLLEHLIEAEGRGRAVVSLDDLMERELAKTDPKMFFQIDELQRHFRRCGD